MYVNVCDIQQTHLKTTEVCHHVFCTEHSCISTDILWAALQLFHYFRSLKKNSIVVSCPFIHTPVCKDSGIRHSLLLKSGVSALSTPILLFPNAFLWQTWNNIWPLNPLSTSLLPANRSWLTLKEDISPLTWHPELSAYSEAPAVL